MSKRLLTALLAEGWIYGEDADGFVQAEPDLRAVRFKVTPAGRVAMLTQAQTRALVEQVGDDGSLSPRASRPAVRGLVRLGLVQYRDDQARVVADDGDRGPSGPLHAAFRTEVGAVAAALLAPGHPQR